MKNIPSVDLSGQYLPIAAELEAAVKEVLASGRYIGGPLVSEFEAQFAAYLGATECVACNSGTDALYLALRALQIGPSDEVITTPFTFIATAEAISAVGATPVFVDIDPQTFNLDLEQLSGAVTGQTRAIIPVHLFGQPVDMTRLMAIANSHGLAVIEDCAQATGGEWAGQKLGTIGLVGCFSFYPTKNLAACGDAGAVITRDRAIASTVWQLRDHGRRQGYEHEHTGINSRLDAIQAAILKIKLKYLDTWNEQRRQIASRYHLLLQTLPDIIRPQEYEGGLTVWNQYTIRVTSQAKNSPISQRDWVRSQLRQHGVSTMVYYPLPLHLQPVYKHLGYQPGQLPVAEQACREVLSLPMFPELDSQQQAIMVDRLLDLYCEGSLCP
ncbi:MAG: DegT/DnrJ/EryC1/StrS family aminotransferase [Hormoscilla sp. SP5CHS1]|nr:DegT/DnrJ/EryC1/StrS family aminotransferase [Hormoscilla sp. SP5CHS1]